MKIEGNGFKYFVNSKEVLFEDLNKLITIDMKVKVFGLNVYYFSPKKENKAEEIEEYPNSLTVNIFNRDIKPVTFYNLFHTIKEVLDYLSSITYTSYTIFNGDKKIAQGANHKQIKMNRLIEEELERQEQQVFKDLNSNNTAILQHCNTLQNDLEKKAGKKETEGKLNYELDWEFIQQLAERMSQNKDKYKPYNWQLDMDVESLKQSLFRHVIEVMKGNYSDNDRTYGHLESIALNSLFINYQLKNNKLGYIK